MAGRTSRRRSVAAGRGETADCGCSGRALDAPRSAWRDPHDPGSAVSATSLAATSSYRCKRTDAGAVTAPSEPAGHSAAAWTDDRRPSKRLSAGGVPRSPLVTPAPYEFASVYWSGASTTGRQVMSLSEVTALNLEAFVTPNGASWQRAGHTSDRRDSIGRGSTFGIEPTNERRDCGVLVDARTGWIYRESNLGKCQLPPDTTTEKLGGGAGGLGVSMPHGSEIANPAVAPWRSIGKLWIREGDALGCPDAPASTCTATVVGRRVIITAAHCLNEFGKWKGDACSFFTPAYTRKNGVEDFPYGRQNVVWIWVPGQWIDYGNYWRDWALVALDSPPPVESWVVQSISNATFYGLKAHMVGYPRDKGDGGIQWSDNCGTPEAYQLSIRHYCHSDHGASGSGIYRNKNGVRRIVAIHHGGGNNQQIGVRLTADRVDHVVDFAALFP